MIKTNLYKGIELEFDEEKHKFLVNGEQKISVTAITSIMDKSKQLIIWAVNLAKDFLLGKLQEEEEITSDHIIEACEQHRIKKEKAATIGDEVHKWAEDYIKGKNPKTPKDENVRNGVKAFLKWVKDTDIKFLNSEMIGYSKKHDYCGIIDLIATIGNNLVLVDLKTSKGIYKDYVLQVAGYAIMYEEMTGEKIDEVVIIKLGKDDGSFEVKTIDDIKEAKRAFLSALQLTKSLKNIKI